MGSDQLNRFELSDTDYNMWPRVDPDFGRLHDATMDEVKKYAQSIAAQCIQVMEVGHGTGITTKELLLADPRIKVTGADLSESLTKGASFRLGKFIRQGRLRLMVRDACVALGNLHKQDIVASVLTIHNMPAETRELVCTRAYAALQPGGLFVSGDKIFPDDADLARKLWETEWIPRLKGLKDLGRPDLYEWFKDHEDDDWKNRLTLREMQLILQNAGFINCKISKSGLYGPFYKVVTAYKPCDTRAA